jgi:hypothetical protein
MLPDQTAASAAWTAPKLLVEALRIGGVSDSDPFGQLMDLAPHPDGGVVVFDIHAGQLLRFDAEGNFVDSIGRSGQGPGEYDGVNGVAVSPQELVYVRSMDGRFLVFDEYGEFRRGWRYPSRLMHDRKLTMGQDGLLVIQETLVPPRRPFQVAGRGFIRLDSAGVVVDTLGPFTTPWDHEAVANIVTQPRKHLEWSPLGYAIAGVSSRLAVAIVWPGMDTILTELPGQGPGYQPDERRQWELHANWLRGRVGEPELIPEVPTHKPVFERIIPSSSGEVWIQRSTPSTDIAAGWVPEAFGAPRVPEWLSPLNFVVLSQDGRVLGEVDGPVGVEPRAVTAEPAVWGYLRGDFGEQWIVKLTVS